MFCFKYKVMFERKKEEQKQSPHSHQSLQAHTFPCVHITLDQGSKGAFKEKF